MPRRQPDSTSSPPSCRQLVQSAIGVPPLHRRIHLIWWPGYKGNVRTRVLAEAILFALIGGAVGVGLGALATAIYASGNGWAIVFPPLARSGGLGAAVLIDARGGTAPRFAGGSDVS